MGIRTSPGTLTVFDADGEPHSIPIPSSGATAEFVLNRLGVSSANHGLTSGGATPLIGYDLLPADASSKIFTAVRALPAG